MKAQGDSLFKHSSSKALMDSITGSQHLRDVAQLLELYKPPIAPHGDSKGEDKADITGEGTSRPPLPKRAAVLVCLFEDDAGDLRVILTKRSANLNSHSGEISLPGGKTEEGDKDDIETATREAKEEIGLDSSLVSVVAVLETFVTKRLLSVVPVVGILSDKQNFTPAINTDEVEAIFDCPLEMFLKDENQRSERREWMGFDYLIHFFDFELNGEKLVIWGLTAWILIRVASIVFQRPPAFEHRRLHFRELYIV